MEKKELLSNYDTKRSARDIVLGKCGQTEPLPFEECYPDSLLSNCRKIGEGSYAEVYLYSNQDHGETVMKVMPIEGDLDLNGNPQKKFNEILSEIVIAIELSNLTENKTNMTSNFNKLIQIRCVKGTYPQKLLGLWHKYNSMSNYRKESPAVFNSNQLYIVLELANAGINLSKFEFQNAAQVYSVFKQAACALAAAENEMEFEHRDLHWCNLLVSPVNKDKKLKFLLDNKLTKISTHGVEASIIDFTLSRMVYEDMVLYNDLSLSPDFFSGKGNYHNTIYRSMLKKNKNNWKGFEPYSNVLWLHYLLEKLVKRIKKGKIFTTKKELDRLERLSYEVLLYKSAQDFVKAEFMPKKNFIFTCL